MKNRQKPDEKLIERFFRKECSYEEARQVIDFLTNDLNRSQVEEIMHSTWISMGHFSEKEEDISETKRDAEEYQTDMDKLYSGILSKMLEADIRKSEKPAGFLQNKWVIPWKIAASVAIFFLVSVTVYFKLLPSETDRLSAKAAISKNTDHGEKLTTKLPDGTRVILNSASKLLFTEETEENERKVVLDGEAYFEVAKDSLRPFIVLSGSIETRALGTSFNIKAYSNSKDVVVSLTEGKVEVTSVAKSEEAEKYILAPGEEVVYFQENRLFAVRNFDYRLATGWKDGILVFENADIDEIKDKLEKWYGIEIIFRNRPATAWSFTTAYQKNVSLESVLDGLKFSKNIRYEISGQQVEIIFN